MHFGLLSRQSAFPVHPASVEKFGKDFVKPGNLVGNGAFMQKDSTPNEKLVVVKNPQFREAANVMIDTEIHYPLDDEGSAKQSGRGSAALSRRTCSTPREDLRDGGLDALAGSETTSLTPRRPRRTSLRRQPVQQAELPLPASDAVQHDPLQRACLSNMQVEIPAVIVFSRLLRPDPSRHQIPGGHHRRHAPANALARP